MLINVKLLGRNSYGDTDPLAFFTEGILEIEAGSLKLEKLQIVLPHVLIVREFTTN